MEDHLTGYRDECFCAFGDSFCLNLINSERELAFFERRQRTVVEVTWVSEAIFRKLWVWTVYMDVEKLS